MGYTQTSEALGHLCVLDLTSRLHHLCARVFADFGAEVIKVEPPEGDPCRRQGPFFGAACGLDCSLTFTYLHRGKKSVTLDLRKEADQQRLRALTVRADVLVEDRQPGELARLGLGYEDLRRLHPGLVYVSVRRGMRRSSRSLSVPTRGHTTNSYTPRARSFGGGFNHASRPGQRHHARRDTP